MSECFIEFCINHVGIYKNAREEDTSWTFRVFLKMLSVYIQLNVHEEYVKLLFPFPFYKLSFDSVNSKRL